MNEAPTTPTVIRSPEEMTTWSDQQRAAGRRIAFVPTLGGLHDGHRSLLEEGRRRGDRLVLSVFLNPTQFGPKEDLAKYPQELEADLAIAGRAGTDVCFAPTRAQMYPPGFQTEVQVKEISQGLCGDLRPGHFAGVATVVTKLFTIVRPHLAVFGEKDFQQLALVRRLSTDLNLGVEIIPMPTVREPDGLAMSTRNRYLSPTDRERALSLSRALQAAREAAVAGERDVAALVAKARAILDPAVDKLDYVEIRNADTLAPMERLDVPGVILVAAFVGTTRLIDNMRL